MRYGRTLAVLAIVALAMTACSKDASTTTSGASGTSTQSGSSILPPVTGGGQGSSQEEASEGAEEASGEGDLGSQAASGKAVITAGAGGVMSFSPSSISVAQGDSIVVKNGGSVPHTFTIKGQGIDVTVQPGASAHVKIDLSPGTYDFVCTFHQSSGMTGTLTVD